MAMTTKERDDIVRAAARGIAFAPIRAPELEAAAVERIRAAVLEAVSQELCGTALGAYAGLERMDVLMDTARMSGSAPSWSEEARAHAADAGADAAERENLAHSPEEVD